MEVKKAAEAAQGGEPTRDQLEKINTLTKARLNPKQLYVFRLRLCDDQVDREFERFDSRALPELAKLFLGKSGIMDHRWTSQGQVARIFETQVVQEPGGSYLQAWAYIPRGGRHEELIGDIEAGIKKEVSVGCAMGRAVCSICGGEYGTCGHVKGEHYDGALCCAILQEPLDAYEFSFVAVPAQREAGVLKALDTGSPTLKDLAEEYGAQQEYRVLCQQAELGKRYQKELEEKLVRLGLSLELGVEAPVLRRLAARASGEDLGALVHALENRLAESLPVTTQLLCREEREEVESGFLI